MAEHAADLPNANSEFAYSSIDDALRALQCALNGFWRFGQIAASPRRSLPRPAPPGTADLAARRHYEWTRNAAIERLTTRMQDVASRHGDSAVVAAEEPLQGAGLQLNHGDLCRDQTGARGN